MSLRNTNTTYGSVAKFFHWLIALLVLCMLIYGFSLGLIPKDYQPVAYNIHKLTGVTIFTLMCLYVLWSLTNPKPEWPFNMPSWQRTTAHIVHTLLYILLLLMPIMGLIGSIASGKPPHIGDMDITLPIEKNKALADAAFATHNLIAAILVVLVITHISAALYHHYLKGDYILRRMLPGRTH